MKEVIKGLESLVNLHIRTGEDGAFEDGVELNVVGHKLKPGDPAPAFDLFLIEGLFRTSVDMGLRNLSDLPSNFILATVNSFDTTVCQREAYKLDSLNFQESPGSFPATIYGVSNDHSEFLIKWRTENGIDTPTFSTQLDELEDQKKFKFGVDYGVHIANWDGQLQRAAFGIVDKKIVYAEYVYDQNGPLPDFEKAIAAVKEAAGVQK